MDYPGFKPFCIDPKKVRRLKKYAGSNFEISMAHGKLCSSAEDPLKWMRH